MPVVVSRSALISLYTLAMPKSVNLIEPSRPTSTFCGLTSRGTHDAPAVGRAQAQRHVVRDDDGTFIIEHPARAQVMAQIGAFDQFHHNEIIAIGLSIIVDLHDIGMLQGRSYFGLALKARHKFGVCSIGIAQYFDRHPTIQNSIAAPVHCKQIPSSNCAL